MIGWIKLHRQIKEHWVFSNSEYLKAWITILIEVNHKPSKVVIDSEIIECGRGQSVNSVSTWCKLFGKGWSPQRVRTFFKLLKNDSMVELEGLRKTTRLTVCNYESYQDDQHADNTQTTNRQQTANTQLTTNKNEKNDKNDKNEKNIYRAFDHLSITTDELEKLKYQYSIEQIDDILDRIANYSKNKTYKSLFSTARNWLKREYPDQKTREQRNKDLINNF